MEIVFNEYVREMISFNLGTYEMRLEIPPRSSPTIPIATIGEPTRSKRSLVVLEAPIVNEYRRIKRRLPLVSIRVRLVEILKLPPGKSTANTPFYRLEECLLSPAPGCPTTACELLVFTYFLPI